MMNQVGPAGDATPETATNGVSVERIAGWSADEAQLRKQLRRLALERDLAIVERERALSELAALRSLLGSLRAG